MNIPTTPIWQTLLLESPWPVLLALAFTAVALGLHALRAGNGPHLRWVRLGAVLCPVALIGIAILARVVRTDREAIREATRDLIAATAPHDDARISARLADHVVLSDPDGNVILQGPELDRAINRLLRRYPIAGQRIATLDAGVQRRGGLATAHSEVSLVTRLDRAFDGGDGPQPSRWGLAWEQRADGSWVINELRCLSWRLQDPTPLLNVISSGWGL